jgi:hypothetical protein
MAGEAKKKKNLKRLAWESIYVRLCERKLGLWPDAKQHDRDRSSDKPEIRRPE